MDAHLLLQLRRQCGPVEIEGQLGCQDCDRVTWAFRIRDLCPVVCSSSRLIRVLGRGIFMRARRPGACSHPEQEVRRLLGQVAVIGAVVRALALQARRVA